MDDGILQNVALQIVAFSLVIVIILANIVESIWVALRHKKQIVRTNRLAASMIGTIAGLISALHGYGEILHGNNKVTGLLFEANTGRSLLNVPSDQWTGWIAMTIIPNLLVTGIVVIIFSIIFIIWSTVFINRKNGGIVLIILAIVMILIGGGFMPAVLGIIAGIFGIRIKRDISV